MATFSGKDGVVEIGANAVANIRGFDVTSESSTVDDTVCGATWETHIATFKRWSASVNCLWDDSDTNGQDLMVEGASLVFHFKPEGSDVGDVDYTGTGTVEQLVRRLTHDGLVEASFNVKGQGALTPTTE